MAATYLTTLIHPTSPRTLLIPRMERSVKMKQFANVQRWKEKKNKAAEALEGIKIEVFKEHFEHRVSTRALDQA